MKGAYISPTVYKYLWGTRLPWPFGKTRVEIDSLYTEFQKSPYRHFLFPADWLQKLKNSETLPPEAVLIVTAKKYSTSNGHKHPLIVLVKSADEALRFFDSGSPATEIFLLTDSVPQKKDLEALMKIPNLKWHFSYKMKDSDLQRSLKILKSQNFSAKSSDFIELTSQKNIDLWFAPEVEVLLQKIPPESPDFSIVIPFQDNYAELEQTLTFLFQSLTSDLHFEILLADDSFSKAHQAALLEILKSHSVPATYLKLHREAGRKKGDLSFRAGVARNCAVRFAHGKELVFLDSDILVGAGLWNNIQLDRKSHQGPLMPRRHFLRSDLSLRNKDYSKISLGQDTLLSWGGHWEDFYRHSTDSDSWKWTSTYCLALPKDLFLELGGFRRSFYCYGFEDTDLGFRLAHSSRPLKVLNQDVFHLPTPTERSEYAADFNQRKKLLKKSFAVFQRSVLEPNLLPQFKHIIS